MTNNSVNPDATSSTVNEDVDNDVDNYALDDTLAGRVVQAGFVGAALSFPDYIKNSKALVTTYILTLASFTGLVGYLNAIDEDEEHSPQPPEESTFPLWQLIAGLSVAGVLKILGLRKLAKALRKQGAKKPWSIFGGLGAVLVFAVSEYAARRG